MYVILLSRVPAGDAAFDVIAGTRFPVALAMAHPMTVGSIPELDPARVEWVRTGYSEPWFPLLPDIEITRQLEKEAAALAGHGLTPGPLWVTGPWSTRLPVTFAAAGVEAVLMNAEHLDLARPGVVAHLDAVLPVLPVTTTNRVGEMDGVDVSVVEVPFGDLDDAALWFSTNPGFELTTVTSYLTANRPSGRRRPTIDDWEARFESDPDRFILHRKLVRLVTRVPERLSEPAELAVLEAERSAPFTGGSATGAHRAIIAARAAIDAERRRGDDWLRLSRLDWDADGAEEIHIELASISMVVAPHRSGGVPTLDLKDPVWPVSSVAGEPGWVLCRFTNDAEGLEGIPIDLAVMRASEVRGGKIELEMTGPLGDGTITVEVGVSTARIDLEYRMEGTGPGRVGPELRLAIGPDARLRVDGSDWMDLEEPVAIAGHKFRITDGINQLVLTSLTPCSVFLRPGVEGTGLVAWAQWTTAGTDSHHLLLDLTAP